MIDEQILCVHGGLSPDIKTLDQIRTIERNQEIPHKGAFCDLVWSDPEDVDTWAISPRGAGWLFGSKVTNEVCWAIRVGKPVIGKHPLTQVCQPPFTYFSNLLCFSLFTSTTWSSSAVHTSWFTKATSSCLMRNWWPCGQRPTTATAVGTLPPSWSSRTSTDESPSCFEPFPTLNVWYLLEQPPPTFSNDKAEVFS